MTPVFFFCELIYTNRNKYVAFKIKKDITKHVNDIKI